MVRYYVVRGHLCHCRRRMPFAVRGRCGPPEARSRVGAGSDDYAGWRRSEGHHGDQYGQRNHHVHVLYHRSMARGSGLFRGQGRRVTMRAKKTGPNIYEGSTSANGMTIQFKTTISADGRS